MTTTHVPVHSTISGMRLLSSHALLTSSITYGIVARSVPLTGKVLSGYLDASGVRAGLGIGNPNAEFTPNVSSCAMSSDGGTAKIVWGSRAGHLIFTTAPRAMETSRRSAADIKRCLAADEHDGAVLDVQWVDTSNGWVISSGADSCVKLWDAKTASCPWTSGPNLIAFVPDRCLKVAACAQYSFVVSVHASGDIHLWTGFDFSVPARAFDDVKAFSIQCPLRTSTEGYDAQLAHDVKTLSIDSACPSPTILVAYQNDPFFYRVRVDPATGHIDTTAFGDPFFGSTSVVVPFFRADPEQSSFVLVGDHLGCVSLYAWDTDAACASPGTQAVGPARKFEAHADGASVTAIAWNGLTLVTGSVRGATHVWDALTFAPLRAFASPVPRLRGRAAHPGVDLAERESVRHILVNAERDALFVGIGDRVMAWRAGPVPKSVPGGVRGRHSGGALGKKRALNAKYLGMSCIIHNSASCSLFDSGQLELNQTIQESQSLLKEERKDSKKSFGREQEHRAGLNNLGLSEAEAVEYILMLSRDEAAANAAASSSSSLAVEEGIFEGDFDFDNDFASQTEDDTASTASSRRPSTGASVSTASGVSASRTYSSSSSASSSSHLSVASHRSGLTTTTGGRLIPRVAPADPSSNEKIRVSPPFREEPMEAGPARGPGDDGPAAGTRVHIAEHYFPPIASAGTSPIPTGSAAMHAASHALRRIGSRTPPGAVSPAPGGSPQSVRSSAWSVPLRAPGGSAGASPVSSASAARGAWAGPSRVSPPAWAAQQQSRADSGASAIAISALPLEEMDDDLRFALELSLVEARSRGEAA